jgi:hypothetical protein
MYDGGLSVPFLLSGFFSTQHINLFAFFRLFFPLVVSTGFLAGGCQLTHKPDRQTVSRILAVEALPKGIQVSLLV